MVTSELPGRPTQLYLLVKQTGTTADDVCTYGHTYSRSKDQPGEATNSARGQLDRENEYFPVPVCA